jgi:hypothetical protein
MEKHDSPWQDGAFFICTKCGRRDDGQKGQSDFAENAKKEFKGRMKDLGLGKNVRVMTSSCLSLCPPDRQVAAFCPSSGEMELIVFDAKNEKEQAFEWLVAKARSK